MAHEAGKGDAPRKMQDQKAYSEGYDRIFSKKKLKQITEVAIKNNDSVFHLPKPFRHHNILHTGYVGKPSEDYQEGFLDEDGNFLDRKSAYVLANQNGQLKRREDTELFKYYQGDELFSEDLW